MEAVHAAAVVRFGGAAVAAYCVVRAEGQYRELVIVCDRDAHAARSRQILRRASLTLG